MHRNTLSHSLCLKTASLCLYRKTAGNDESLENGEPPAGEKSCASAGRGSGPWLLMYFWENRFLIGSGQLKGSGFSIS